MCRRRIAAEKRVAVDDLRGCCGREGRRAGVPPSASFTRSPAAPQCPAPPAPFSLRPAGNFRRLRPLRPGKPAPHHWTPSPRANSTPLVPPRQHLTRGMFSDLSELHRALSHPRHPRESRTAGTCEGHVTTHPLSATAPRPTQRARRSARLAGRAAASGRSELGQFAP